MNSIQQIIENIYDTYKDHKDLKKLGLSEEEIDGYFDLYEDNFDRSPGSLAHSILKRKEATHEK